MGNIIKHLVCTGDSYLKWKWSIFQYNSILHLQIFHHSQPTINRVLLERPAKWDGGSTSFVRMMLTNVEHTYLFLLEYVQVVEREILEAQVLKVSTKFKPKIL